MRLLTFHACPLLFNLSTLLSSTTSRARIFKMSENILFESSFKISDVNSSKYDRVSRIKAFSEGDSEVLLTLDVNTELYPLNVDDRMTVALALSLNLDGSKDDGKGWRKLAGESRRWQTSSTMCAMARSIDSRRELEITCKFLDFLGLLPC